MHMARLGTWWSNWVGLTFIQQLRLPNSGSKELKLEKMVEHRNKSKPYESARPNVASCIKFIYISQDVQGTRNALYCTQILQIEPSVFSSVLWSGPNILVHIGHPLVDVDGFGGTWPPQLWDSTIDKLFPPSGHCYRGIFGHWHLSSPRPTTRCGAILVSVTKAYQVEKHE